MPRAKQARPGVPILPAAAFHPAAAGGKFQHRGSGASLPASILRAEPAHVAHVGRSRVFPARRVHCHTLPDHPNPHPVLASRGTPEPGQKRGLRTPKTRRNQGMSEAPPARTGVTGW